MKDLVELAKSVVLQNKKLQGMQPDQKKEEDLDAFEKESSYTLTLSLDLVDFISQYLADAGEGLTSEQNMLREKTLSFKEAVNTYLQYSKKHFTNPLDFLAKQEVFNTRYLMLCHLNYFLFFSQLGISDIFEFILYFWFVLKFILSTKNYIFQPNSCYMCQGSRRSSQTYG